MASPARQPADDRPFNARILVQAKKAVGAEVDYLPTIDLHFTMRPKPIDDEVLEMAIREECRKMLDEANQAVLPHGLSQLVHRGDVHAFLLFRCRWPGVQFRTTWAVQSPNSNGQRTVPLCGER